MTQLFSDLCVHSTCRDCGLAMRVTNEQQTVHPMCTAKPTELEDLSYQWVDAILAGDELRASLIIKRIDHLEQVIDLPGAAVNYASWGWKVFPLGRHSKMPAIPKAKGGNGFKDATSDVERINRWWARHNDHNIGLATGHAFDVVDIDTKDSKGNPDPAGVLAFLNLLAQKDLPECHGIAITASGGMHLYVKPTGRGNYAGKHHEDDTPEELEARGFKSRPINMPALIDYRGLGGYVVAPPSTLGETWRSYTWLTVPSPELKGEKNDWSK